MLIILQLISYSPSYFFTSIIFVCLIPLFGLLSLPHKVWSLPLLIICAKNTSKINKRSIGNACATMGLLVVLCLLQFSIGGWISPFSVSCKSISLAWGCYEMLPTIQEQSTQLSLTKLYLLLRCNSFTISLQISWISAHSHLESKRRRIQCLDRLWIPASCGHSRITSIMDTYRCHIECCG